MSSNLDIRNHSALMKRAEQLKRWEESDTNKESPHPKPEKNRKIRFPSGCVFLASCLSGDKDEVVKLLEDGADINTANVDGLTALHQACIDDNLDMVEFLVKQGADINRQDNEGWTPLHATASCGFVSIARFLVENGADLTAVNSDGELAVDISHCNDMADYLQNLVQELGIDCDAARRAEEELMYADAKKWLRSDASELDTAHPKTGATALHVAAAKGYSRVLKLIFAGRANVDKQDNDGWTPLHAAAHWCQKEACELLVNQMADMEIRNYAGQTCVDVADRSLKAFLEDLRANNKRNKKRPATDLSRITDNSFPAEKKIENHSPKLIRYDGKDEKEKEDKSKSQLQPPQPPSVPAPSSNSSSTESLKVQSDSINDDDAPWRRSTTRIKVEDTTPKIQVPEKDNKQTSDDVILRRTQSFENDEKFYQKYYELRARIKANSCPILPAGTQTQTQPPPQQPPTVVLGPLTSSNQNLISNSNYSVQRSASLKDHANFRKPAVPPQSPNTPLSTPNAGQVRCLELEAFDQAKNGNRSPTPTSSYPIANAITKPKLSPGSIFKNFFKSFVPPVRDEESETQRKAHARSVRQTRRSTQGVTLEEIKSAEELIKKKNANINNNNNDTETESQNTPSTSSTTTTTTPKPSNDNERIPSPNPKPEEMNNEITATFTIKPRDSLNSADNSKSKIVSASASYTLSPPVTTSLTLPVIVPPSLNLDKLKSTTSATTASVSTPSSSSSSSSSTASSSTSSTASSSTASGASENETESLEEFNMEMINNDDDDHNRKPQNKVEPPPPPPPPVTVMTPKPIPDEKRSLFDLDNENSITLADKLRNEANKYYDDGVVKFSEDDVVLRRGGTNSDSNATAERRPSWRLKFDAGSKFKLEDASSGNTYPPPNNTIISSAPAVIAAANLSSSSAAQRRNISNNTPPITSNQRPVSAPTNNSNASTQETSSNDTNRIRDSTKSDLALSKRSPNSEDKENEQENDSRAALATQSVIQRRRKPKRRSTGVVHVDMDDIDPDKQDSGDNDEKESGTERTARSRLGSTNSLAADGDNKQSNENGEIDYKALWEAAMLENDKLKQLLKKKDEEIVTAKAAVERFAHTTNKNSLSENEKRERRAMERKMSEMEEELKQLDAFKTENKRLKEENGALIRVISKLSK